MQLAYNILLVLGAHVFIFMDLGGLGSWQGHRIIEVTSAFPQSSFLVTHDFLTVQM